MRVDILNGKGESVNKLPGDRKRLLVELKVIWHGKVSSISFLGRCSKAMELSLDKGMHRTNTQILKIRTESKLFRAPLLSKYALYHDTVAISLTTLTKQKVSHGNVPHRSSSKPLTKGPVGFPFIVSHA